MGAVALVLLAGAGIATCTGFDWERERACQRAGGVLMHIGSMGGRGCFKATLEPLEIKE